MRSLSVTVVLCSVAILLASWLLRRDAATESWLPSPDIHVTAAGQTLASLAAALHDPHRLSYDPQTRTATAHASLIIEGELVLGRQDQPELGEKLQLATQVCGDLRIEVRPGGTLRLYHSALSTVSEILSANACSRGYAMFVDGTLIMENSRITYLSGSTSQVLRGERASADIRNSSFSYCDGAALTCAGVDGRRIRIQDCEIRCSGNWGLVASGKAGAPLVLHNCVLDAPVGAVLIADEGARVRLVDCALDESKLAFSRQGGEIMLASTRRVKVVRGPERQCAAGLRVRAVSQGNGPQEVCEARTDEHGVAELVLTDWVARPGRSRRGNANMRGPHRLTVLDETGQVLAEVPEMTARGRDLQPVEIIAGQP